MGFYLYARSDMFVGNILLFTVLKWNWFFDNSRGVCVDGILLVFFQHIGLTTVDVAIVLIAVVCLLLSSKSLCNRPTNYGALHCFRK